VDLDPSTPFVNESVGGWAACQTCHDLIEENNFSRLSRHSMALLLAEHPELEGEMESVQRHLNQLHKLFRKNRRGAAEPLEIAKGNG